MDAFFKKDLTNAKSHVGARQIESDMLHIDPKLILNKKGSVDDTGKALMAAQAALIRA